MALSVETSREEIFHHVVAQARGRQPLYVDPPARARAARQLADSCLRHRLRCLVWCVTDRCLHLVLHGAPPALTLATQELVGSRLRQGYWLSTAVNPDIYLLEVARHALLAPVRAGLCRRAADWPFSSARETLGLRPAPSWLDLAPLHELLGRHDGHGTGRMRRFMETC